MTPREYEELERNPYRKIFRNIVCGVNFITPVIIDYRKIGKYIIELSTNNNTNILGKMYGITVIKQINDKYVKDDEKCVVKFNWDDVEKYLKELKNE